MPNATASASSADLGELLAVDPVPLARLGADDLAVELGEPDGDGGGEQRPDDDAAARRVLLETTRSSARPMIAP